MNYHQLIIAIIAIISHSLSFAEDQKTNIRNIDLDEFNRSIISQISESDQFPSDKKAILHWLIKPTKIIFKEQEIIAGVVQIRFSGLSNSYCRFAVNTGSKDQKSILIKIPESVNHDSCKSARLFSSIDINNDSIADYAFSVKTQSNRYSFNIEEPMVFLGQPEKPEAFCYSDSASRAFAGLISLPATDRRAALRTLLKRSDENKFVCD